MTVALIDGDVLIYQAALVSEQATNWGDGMWTLHAFEPDAIAYLEKTIAAVQETTGAQGCIICLSCGTHNFRKDVLPSYKGNRKDTRKPMLIPFLRDYIRDRYVTKEIYGLEGDDVIGITATSGGDYIICTIDKDLKTIPGNHFNMATEDFFDITEEEADWYFMMQTLTGDATDGYSGCPKVGVKTAEKILGTELTIDAMWPKVVEAYEKAGLSEDYALEQARMARILRATDYDFEKGEVILWEPA